MKFFGQAKKFFNVLAAEPETKAEHFNVRCVSGHRVRGERTEGYQALRCPACGEGVFVLPRSPLPIPAAPKRSETSRSPRTIDRMVDDSPGELTDPAGVSVDLGGDEHAAADADIIWDDALPEAARAPKPPPRPLLSPTGSVDLGIAGPPDAAGGATARAKSTRKNAESRERRQGAVAAGAPPDRAGRAPPRPDRGASQRRSSSARQQESPRYRRPCECV